MNILFVQPAFPASQRHFVRALAQAGAAVIGVGESSPRDIDDELRGWMRGYYRVADATDASQLDAAVRWAATRVTVDRVEATTEAHQVAVATVRETHGLTGLSMRAARLARDRGPLQAALREVGVPVATSARVVSTGEVRAFAARVGYPLAIRPHAGVGTQGVIRVDSDIQLSAALIGLGVGTTQPLTVEEFVEGHQGYYDAVTHEGRVVHDWVTHCYPDVTPDSLHRAAPQLVTTNRIDRAPFYAQVRAIATKVLDVLGHTGSALHLDWFSSHAGLHLTAVGSWGPGDEPWTLCALANDVDIHREWAQVVVHGVGGEPLSRTYSAGITGLRPAVDGLVLAYDGIDDLRASSGRWIAQEHLLPPGTAVHAVVPDFEHGAWVRMRHPDVDALRGLLDDVGHTVTMQVV